MFSKPMDGDKFASISGAALPLLDPKTLNFDNALKVVNRTTRFVIPIPEFKDGGELLVYPDGVQKAGEAIKKGEDGSADRGIIFFNGKDRAWQAARGNGKEVILANDVSSEQADALMTKFEALGGRDRISLEGLKTLIEYARNELGITDFYDKKKSSVTSEMAVISEANPLYMIVTKPTVHLAIYHREGFSHNGPVPQVYPEGAVILNDGNYIWGIDAGVFQRNFKAVTENGERALQSLDEEFKREAI